MTLTVLGSDGNSAAVTRPYTVLARSRADFDGSPAPPAEEQVATFTDRSTD